MRVGLVSVLDPESMDTWSGTPWHMIQGFREAGVDVVPIGPLRLAARVPFKAVEIARNRIYKKSVYIGDREPYLLSSFARQINRAVDRAGHLDLLLSPGSIAFSQLETSVPTVIWADATIGLMLDYYDQFSRLSPRTVRNAECMEGQALRRAGLFVGSSEWARAGAVKEYGLAEEKTAAVMYGANLAGRDVGPPPQRRLPDRGERRLLLVGGDWGRKGVQTAIDTVRLMRDAGVDATLDVVGCLPPDDEVIPPFVALHGFIDKQVPEQAARLEELFRRAHLFILPSKAECCAVVLCEAAAYGLPVVASATGGMQSAVDPGVHGFIVEPGCAEDFASSAMAILRDEDTYAAFSAAARAAYEQRLSWPAATSAMIALMQPLVSG